MSLLTEGLVRRGVDVTLFATADSVTSARLVATAPTATRRIPDIDPKVWESLHISTVFERADEFDVIHNSFDFLPLTYSAWSTRRSSPRSTASRPSRIVPVFGSTTRRPTTWPSATPIGTRGSTTWRRSTTASTCGAFEVRATPGDYLLFFGRIHPDKGTVEAIDVAERAGLPLIIAGIVQDEEYFERSRGAARSTATGALRRPGRARSAQRDARRRARPAPPRELRRAVRLQRGRGDGVRHTGDRHARGSMPEIVRDGSERPVASLDEAVAAAGRRRRSGSTRRARIGRASLRRGRMVDDVHRGLPAHRGGPSGGDDRRPMQAS